MQKKFWSLLLSMAMIVSCFSGLALASGGSAIGKPATQIHNPTSVALDMQDTKNINVVVSDSNQVSLQGSVRAQGTNGNTVIMNSNNVNALISDITDGVYKSDTLVLGLVEKQLASNTPYITSTSQLASAISATHPYFVNEFKNTARFWSVDSGGNFSIQYNPAAHTMDTFGYVLNSTINRSATGAVDAAYGIYERLYSAGWSAGNAGNPAGIPAVTAVENRLNSFLAALAPVAYSVADQTTQLAVYVDAIENAQIALAQLSATVLAYIDANYTDGATGEYGIFTTTAPDNTLPVGIPTAALAAAQTAIAGHVADIIGAIDNIRTEFVIADNYDMEHYFDNLLSTVETLADTLYTDLTTPTLDALASVDLTVYNGVVNTASALSAVYSAHITNLWPYNALPGATHVTSGISGLGTDIAAATLVYSSAAATNTTILAKLTALNGAINAALTAAKVVGLDTFLVDQREAFVRGYTSDSTAITAQLAILAQLKLDLAGSGATPSTTILPIDRYLQRTAFTVKYKYKLAESATSLQTGTSGTIWLNNALVTAEGTTIPYDVDYEVWQGDPGAGHLLATGRTVNGGKFNIAVTIQNSDTIALFPTSRTYTDNNGTKTDRLNPTDSNQRFNYDLVTFSRKAYNEISLTESTAISGVGRSTIVFDELRTNGDHPDYDLLDGTTGWVPNPAVKMYGASYAVYDGAGANARPLIRTYTVNQTTYDVVRDFAWGNAGDPATIFEETAANDETPTFRINANDQLTITAGGTLAVANFEYASSGNISLRVRHTGAFRNAPGLEANETFQSIVTLSVEAPGQVATISGNELKKIDAENKFAHEVQLYVQEAFDTVRMVRISYDNKSDLTHNLDKNTTSRTSARDAAKGTTLTYIIESDRVFVYMPWDMVKQGGSDIRIELEFFDGADYVTNKEVVIKNLLWKVETDKDILTVAANNSLVATVTNEDDVEQNRATVKIVDKNTSLTNPLKTNDNPSRNVVGGRYTLSNVNPRTGGDMYLFVQEFAGSNTTNLGDVKAMKLMQALGTNDLLATLTEGYDAVVTGLKKQLRFHVDNKNGANELNLVGAQVLSLDGVTKNTNFVKYEDLTFASASNGNYAVELVGLKPGTYLLRVYTSNMVNYTDIEFEVLPLTIKTPDGFDVLTWDNEIIKNSSFYNANKMTFTVIDPLTDNPVLVEIKASDIAFVKDDGDESEMKAVVRTRANMNSYNSGVNVSISDTDFNPYNLTLNKSNHEFWVGVVDGRSLVLRNNEGELSLSFTFSVRENNSSGDPHDVEGMVIPIKLATLVATPDTVITGQKTDIVLTVLDASGRPAQGVAVRGDTEGALSALTNADGQTTYTFTPVTAGFVKRFDLVGFIDQVFTTVTVVDYASAPVITLNPYISRTNKSEVTITGTVTDEISLKSFSVDNGLASSVLTGRKSYDFTVRVPLTLGSNTVRLVVENSNGTMTDKEIVIVRDSMSVVVLTIGSTETTGVTGLDVAPQVVNGRTMLPIRFIFQNVLKGIVDYQDGVITASVGEHVIVMVVGSTEATIDGARVTLLSGPFITDEGRTLAPIREILEAIGVTVVYNESLQTVTLYGAGDIDEITDTDLVAPVGIVPPVGTVDDDADDVDTDDIDTDDVVDTDDIDNTDEVEEGGE